MDVCESYDVLIKGTGEYDYNGIHGVPILKKESGVLISAKRKEITALVGSIDWSNLDSKYGNSGTGTQRKELIYTTGGKSTTIVYYRLEPQEIRELVDAIDKIMILDEK